MTTKNEFLATVRQRLEGGIPENHIRPMPTPTRGPIEYAARPTSLRETFVAAVLESSAEIVPEGEDPVRYAIDAIGANSVAVSDDPECAGIIEALHRNGMNIADAHDADALAHTDLGITGAVAGIALTGSIVVDSTRAGGRLVSLVPRVHLALLDASRIVGNPGDVLRSPDAWFPDGLPSNVAFITGPSRSADIELQLTKGVHGPQRVFIALI